MPFEGTYGSYDVNRRKFLATTGAVGTMVFAGCTGSNADTEESTSSTDKTTTETTTEATTETTTEVTTETTQSAEFTVESIDMPDEVQISEDFTPTITVKNTGGEYGFLRVPIYSRKDDGEWEKGGEWRFSNVPPGTTQTAEANESWKLHYLGTYEYSLGDFPTTSSVDAVARKMPFGGEYTSPGSIKMSVKSPEFKARYTRMIGDEEDVVESPDEGTFLFADVSVENTNEEAANLPHYTSWQVIADNRQYEPDWDGYKDGRYEGGNVQAGIKRDGYLYYELPETTRDKNYQIVWSEEYRYGTATAYWSE